MTKLIQDGNDRRVPQAFRGTPWGSKVGVRVMSWLDDVSELADLPDFLGGVVGTLAGLLG